MNDKLANCLMTLVTHLVRAAHITEYNSPIRLVFLPLFHPLFRKFIPILPHCPECTCITNKQIVLLDRQSGYHILAGLVFFYSTTSLSNRFPCLPLSPRPPHYLTAFLACRFLVDHLIIEPHSLLAAFSSTTSLLNRFSCLPLSPQHQYLSLEYFLLF